MILNRQINSCIATVLACFILILNPSLSYGQVSDVAVVLESFRKAGECIDMGDFHGAQKEYDQIIKLLPNTAHAFGNRGSCKVYTDDPIGAIFDLDSALLIDASLFRFYNNRGVAKHRVGEYIEAIEDFNLALIHMPNYTYALNNRATTWMKLGNTSAALSDLNQALAHQPENGRILFNRAYLKMLSEDSVGAKIDIDSALRYEPDLCKAIILLGAIAVIEGDFITPCALWHRALEAKCEGSDNLVSRFCP